MALLKASAPLDLAAFARGMEVLPRYARPLFLRVSAAILATETHKPKRGVYAAEGFDPAQRKTRYMSTTPSERPTSNSTARATRRSSRER